MVLPWRADRPPEDRPLPKLTKRRIDALAIEATDYFAWDDEVSGFGVRVLPSGVKSYLVQYRSGGRTRRVAIGKHGTVTVEEARKRARDLLGQVAKGDNPAEAISTHRRSPTMAALCERFFADHVRERCKASTQGEYRRAIDLFITPAIGAFKVADVTRADIAKLQHAHRGKPYQANRTLGVLSKMFNLAEVWGLRPDGSNPCRHVPKHPEKKRERFLSDGELARLVETLAACQADGSETPFVVAAFRLLILTGCRLGEIQTLRWEWIGADLIELPDSKTGARRIPLNGQARAVLAALPRTAGAAHVIEGARADGHVTDLQKPWRRIRGRAGLDGVRIHDLRHTYASRLVGRGETIQMVGKLLGHTQIQTTMRYAHLADDPVRAAAERAAGAMPDMLSAGARLAAE
jgi:integrase